jgi:hypothetical protein
MSDIEQAPDVKAADLSVSSEIKSPLDVPKGEKIVDAIRNLIREIGPKRAALIVATAILVPGSLLPLAAAGATALYRQRTRNSQGELVQVDDSTQSIVR